MLSDLEPLGPTADALSRRAREAGVLLFWRAQIRRAYQVVVREGRVEGTSVTSMGGHGVQINTEEGHSALGSRDDFDADSALSLFDRVLAMAGRGGRAGLDRDRPLDLTPRIATRIPPTVDAFGSIDLERVRRRLLELEGAVSADAPGVALQLSYRAELEAWRIFRSDGTDVLFAMPRANLGLRATGGASDSHGAGRHSVSTSVFRPDPDLPWDAASVDVFLTRARQAARLAGELVDAPMHPAGSFPLVIDYALAKGLAHEAFGHASEADGFRSSVLAREGRFRTGDRVGTERVSIIDEPVEEDHAWQPFSSNGLVRDRVVLVDHGVLRDALSDPWSAAAGGVRLTGSARAASFRSAPLPRMTNIRIEVDEPHPAPGAFEDYGPAEVRDLLARAGVFRRHRRVVFLSGYSGGQVNTATGDFVFHSRAIYDLSEDGIGLYKPAIFSGSMFGALESIREAFGPLKLDAIGYCGKWGQSVPSSGGSHYFLTLDPHPGVRLGGR